MLGTMRIIMTGTGRLFAGLTGPFQDLPAPRGLRGHYLAHFASKRRERASRVAIRRDKDPLDRTPHFDSA